MPRIRPPRPTPISSSPGTGGIVEIQATAEARAVRRGAFAALLALARSGIARARRAAARGARARLSRDGARGASPAAQLVIATHNNGKLVEIGELLQPFGSKRSAPARSACPSRRRPARTFEGNAALKARAAADGERPAGAGRRFRPVGAGARRRARHLFGALGRPGQGLRAGHGAGRAASWTSRAPTAAPGSSPRSRSPGRTARRGVPRRGRMAASDLPAARRPRLRLRPDLRARRRRARPSARWSRRPRTRISHRAARLRQAEGARLSVTEPDRGFGVYVHWPYCARICPYCDFNVQVRDRRSSQAALAARHRRRPGGAGGADRAAAAGLDLLRRRHALADGAGRAAAIIAAARGSGRWRGRPRGHAGGQPHRRRGRRASPPSRAAGVNRLSLGCSRWTTRR